MNKKKVIFAVCAAAVIIAAVIIGITAAGRKTSSETTEPVCQSTVNAGTAGEDYTDTLTPAQPEGSFTFCAEKLDGGTLDYSELSGNKLIMINAWEPWCGPCVNEMPDIERLYEAYSDKGFTVIGVCSEDYAADARNIVSENGITYPVVFSGDPNFEILDSGYVPTTVFVDGSGNILTSEPLVGARSYSEWESVLNTYLN